MGHWLVLAGLFLSCFGWAEPIHLSVGDGVKVRIDSRRYWNDTGVFLSAGETYRFSVRPEARWYDWFIATGADGYSSAQAPSFVQAYFKSQERFRRAPASDWFCLIGNLDRDPAKNFPLGASRTVTLTRSGTFHAFANDLPDHFYNNFGWLDLVIERVR